MAGIKQWKKRKQMVSMEHSVNQRVMVSICCITFNQEAYIRDALDGFINQKTNFKYEVLIHDDASTDRTAEIIREYQEKYPDVIKPILQTVNQYSLGLTNVSGTWNFPRAVENGSKYIAMCEGDDYWIDENKLQRQVDYMESHPDCALTFHSAKVEVQGKAVTERMMRPYNKERIVKPEEIIDKTSGYATASLLFRTEMVRNLPAFYKNAPIADIPLQLLAANMGYGYYMDEPMCVYRLSGAASWTTMMKQGNYEKKQQDYARAMKNMYRGFDEFSGKRFHKTVVRAWRRLYFLTQVNTKHYDVVLDKKNREFYKELNLRTRFFIRFEAMFPSLHHWLQDMYQRGQNTF